MLNHGEVMKTGWCFVVCLLGVTAKRLTPPKHSDLPAWIEKGSFENFGKTQTMNDVLLARPTNLNEVQDTIAYAKKNNYRVRAAGHAHSWSPLFSDNGHIVLFTRGIQPGTGEQWISLNEEGSEVTIMTGVNTGELKDFLIENHKTLLSNVILQVVEMGGVVGSICHGVGNTEGTVSDYVVQMRIVNHNGDLVKYNFRGERSNTDKANAVKGHLGLFGIVYDMTLSVQDEVMVDIHNTWNTVQEVFYDAGALKKLKDEMWDPSKDRIWGRVINEASDKERGFHPVPMNPLPFAYTGDPFPPKFTPLVLQTASLILEVIYNPDTIFEAPLMEAIHYQPASLLASKVPTLDMEVAIDAGENYANVIQAVTDFRDLLKAYGLEAMFPVNVALEMRLVRNSNILLAPAQAGDPYTMYIEVLSIQGTNTWEQFLKDLAGKWRQISGCRFHWAKQWRVLGDDIVEYMKTSYGENVETFKTELRNSGADPDHMFSNEIFDSILFHDTPSARHSTCQKHGCE